MILKQRATCAYIVDIKLLLCLAYSVFSVLLGSDLNVCWCTECYECHNSAVICSGGGKHFLCWVALHCRVNYAFSCSMYSVCQQVNCEQYACVCCWRPIATCKISIFSRTTAVRWCIFARFSHNYLQAECIIYNVQVVKLHCVHHGL